MNFDPGTWWLVGILAAAVTGVVGYFLKRTMNKVDEHDKDINHIKQTYFTKDEAKDQRTEFRGELTKILAKVDELKENCLFKADFYRSQADINESIKRIYDLLIKQSGGHGND